MPIEEFLNSESGMTTPCVIPYTDCTIKIDVQYLLIKKMGVNYLIKNTESGMTRHATH
jgi:hypothetical protein